MRNPDTIRVVIAEDNPASRKNLLACLGKTEQVKIVGVSENGCDAVTLIDREKPDLVFLDVEMPGKNGFEVLQTIAHEPGVIFVTAHENFAVKAFEVNGIDYLVKPVSQERLDAALEKAKKSLGTKNKDIWNRLSTLVSPKSYKKRFTVTVKDQIYIIPREEIFGFKAEDKYVFLSTRKKTYFYNATLKQLIQYLDPDAFIKVNKSHIVAIDKIKKLKKNFKFETCLVLDDDKETTIKISKNHLSALKEKLES